MSDWQPDLTGTAVPGWVGWVAMDADGALWGYQQEPNQHDIGWYENEVGRYIKLGQGAPTAQWQQCLWRCRD